MNSGPIVLKSSDRPKRRRAKDLITQAQAEKAADACGMAMINIGSLKDKARVGKYIEQLGATQLSRAAILARKHNLELDIQKIQGFIDQQDGGDICLIMDLYKLKALFAETALRHDQAQMKIKGETTIVQGGAPVLLPFPPGTKIAAQIPDQLDEVKNAK